MGGGKPATHLFGFDVGESATHLLGSDVGEPATHLLGVMWVSYWWVGVSQLLTFLVRCG